MITVMQKPISGEPTASENLVGTNKAYQTIKKWSSFLQMSHRQIVK
jgi:hypothetical protein